MNKQIEERLPFLTREIWKLIEEVKQEEEFRKNE